MKEISKNQNSAVVTVVKKMEYVKSLKLGEKGLSPSTVRVKPKMVTRLLRNRVVLEEIDADTAWRSNETALRSNEIVLRSNETALRSNETALRSNETALRSNETVLRSNETALRSNVPPTIQKDLPAVADRDTAERKILNLALEYNIPTDVIMRKVMAFSPVVKVERQILIPYRSSRILETTGISTDEEEITSRREMSVDRENDIPNYVLLLEEEQEKRIKRLGKSIDREKRLERMPHVSLLEKVSRKKTGMSTDEEDATSRREISMDRENDIPNYVLLLEEEQEKRIKRWEKSIDREKSLERMPHVSTLEKVRPKKAGKSIDREKSLERMPYVNPLEKVKPKKTGISADEEETTSRRKISVDRENDIPNYVLLLEEEQEKRIKRWGKSIDREKSLERMPHMSTLEKVRPKKTESSPCSELASPVKSPLYNKVGEVELHDESSTLLEGENNISIQEDQYADNSDSIRKYCGFCNVGYTNYFVLEKHKKKCRLNPANLKTYPRKIFYCRYCYFGITNEEYFKVHESRCHNEQMNDNKPKKRLKRTSFEEPSKFKSKRLKTGKNKCPHCDYTSDKMGHLNQHVRIHSKVPLCICEICDKGFNRISSLRLHMVKHLNVAEEISLVDSVEIWEETATKIVLEVKLNGRNIEIIKYECNKCDFVTTVLCSLEMHMNTMHLKKHVFKCNICPFTSMVKANLRQHLNLHTRERTYKCPKCPYETLNKTYLKKHDNQVHTKAKVFQCSFCEFKCYRQENLNCHVNSMHSKKKRYDCKLCSFFSYYQSNLIGHVKTVHQGLNIRKPV